MDLSTFPKILTQPAPNQGFRFAIDSLLLSSFVQPKSGFKLMDLGCGCGVIGIGILLRHPDLNLECWGIEREKAMLELARANLKQLRLNNYKLIGGDIKAIKNFLPLPEYFDQIIFNPPYRSPQQGKLSPVFSKNRARFTLDTSLADFLHAASFLLKNKGEVFLSYLSEEIVTLFRACQQQRLEPKELIFIHPTLKHSPKICLLKTKKNAKPGLKIHPPLVLFNQSPPPKYTAQTLKFCPFLSNL